ncbi:hypothetical protein Dsin_032671 [Dipteronia sinensis]|uniref:Uncharacterized protein n=1 Tax=Dipteronia sinensis TaxID=43782 RepID=A0AAD9ZA57_9ROSI|nr:hypothetical protein Dsin_032671 [Dipteronia sinensis]
MVNAQLNLPIQGIWRLLTFLNGDGNSFGISKFLIELSGHFLWTLLHDKLLTNLQTLTRGRMWMPLVLDVLRLLKMWIICYVVAAFHVGFGIISLKDWVAANCPVSARIGFVFLVAWNPPNEGWIKLNIDGSRDTNSGIITAGGVMRNSMSQWMKGFVVNKGVRPVSWLKTEDSIAIFSTSASLIPIAAAPSLSFGVVLFALLSFLLFWACALPCNKKKKKKKKRDIKEDYLNEA